MCSFCSQILLPVVYNTLFDKSFKSLLGWWRFKELQRMREAIFQADITNLVEPGMRRGGSEVEDVSCMIVDDVVLQSSDHAKDRELS